MNLITLRRGWQDAMVAHYVKGIDYTDTKAIVIESARVIYIPIPKAANSSVRKALCPTLGIDPATVTDVQGDPRIRTQPCSTALPLAGSDWFVFTIVRHPFDRAYSAWRNKLEDHIKPFKALKGMGLKRGDSFRTFLGVCNLWPRKMLNDHFVPQSDLLGAALARPDFKVYHMEDLAQSWSEICDRIEAQGGTRPLDIPHLNRAAKPTKADYTWSERRLMLRLYLRDFRALGYDQRT